MEPNESQQIIKIAGGPAAFARLLGITNQPNFHQKINNWRARGIPAAVVLEHYQVISKLQAKAARHG